MAKRNGQMSLGAFLLFTGHHLAAWRHPGVSDSTRFRDFAEFARIAEDAKLDAIFFADGVSVRSNDLKTAGRKAHSGYYPFEPITLLSALATVTSKIGLVATACRVLSRSPVVHFDGPASVRAAYTLAELRSLADRAGLTGATVRPVFLCRMLLTWSRP